MPKINGSTVRRTPVPLPPLAEQRRIVSKIESLQERSSRARRALSEVGPLLEQFRQSVLRAAFSGRLTADWRAAHRDVEPATELLSRIRTERRHRWEQSELAKYEAKGKKPPKNWKDKYKEPEPIHGSEVLFEIPETWCWTTLKNVADVKGGLAKGKRRKETDQLREVPYLRVANVQNGYLKLEEILTIPATPTEIEQLTLRDGDILFNEGGDRDKLGRGWVWSNEIPECIHQNHVFRARLLDEGLQPFLISHYGNSFGMEYFTRVGTQSVNLASISLGKLSGLPLPVMPADEATELESRITELFTSIEAIFQQASGLESSLTQLDQSILAKAFRGELVPQDPRDEPASELLARIRTTREATATKKKSKPRKGTERTKRKQPDS